MIGTEAGRSAADGVLAVVGFGGHREGVLIVHGSGHDAAARADAVSRRVGGHRPTAVRPLSACAATGGSRSGVHRRPGAGVHGAGLRAGVRTVEPVLNTTGAARGGDRPRAGRSASATSGPLQAEGPLPRRAEAPDRAEERAAAVRPAGPAARGAPHHRDRGSGGDRTAVRRRLPPGRLTTRARSGAGTGAVAYQGGPRRLVDEVVRARGVWEERGAPWLYDFGLIRAEDGQWIRSGGPGGPRRPPLTPAAVRRSCGRPCGRPSGRSGTW